MSKILLVEAKRRKSGYKQMRYAPLGLQKIATFHMERGDEVEFVQGFQRPKATPDLVYITTLFTDEWKGALQTINLHVKHWGRKRVKVGGIMATLLPELIKQQTGVIPHVGLWAQAEECSPNYDLFEKHRWRYLTFTSRGCPRKCGFCVVQHHEPEYFDKPNWYNELPPGVDKLYFGDNNFLAKPLKLIERDTEIIKSLGHEVDFNQALDTRLMTPKKAALLKGIKFAPLRIAFDSWEYKDHVEKAVHMLREAGLSMQIQCLMLYNFTETPEEIWNRTLFLATLKVQAYPMRYQDIFDIKKYYIGKHWTAGMIKNFKEMSRHLGNTLSTGGINLKPEMFKLLFGETAEQFKRNLRIENIDDYIAAKRVEFKHAKAAALDKEGGISG